MRTSIVSNLVHHPRKLFLRRALFQIHLWAGVLLSLYIAIIGATGSLLVFEEEFTHLSLPHTSFNPNQIAGIPAALASASAAHPESKPTYISAPTAKLPFYRIHLANQTILTLDPHTAAILPISSRTWIDWVRDLHVYLLLGDPGIRVNGIGAIVLLLLAATGLALWWPGIRLWTRGLRISLRHNWRRINFDLHNAIGFWTLLIVSWWAISGIYFAWYLPVQKVVNAISPLQGMRSPTPTPDPKATGTADLATILTQAHAEAPKAFLNGVSLPTAKGGVIYVQMDLRAPGDFSHRDILTFDPATGHLLTVWHYGQNHTLGDWFIWAMHPLHFGTLWGLPAKILWATLGLSLPVLTITGLLMYWNRYLRKRWLSLKTGSTQP